MSAPPVAVKMENAAKPAPLEQFVTPVVTDEEGRKLTRTIRRTDKLKVLMDFYHEMVPEVGQGEGFFVHGRSRNRIRGRDTPEYYKMKDGEEIHFLLEIKPDMLVTPVVQDFRGRSFTRTMRMTDRMQVLMDFYTAMVPSDADGGGVFLYCGKHVSGEQTPAGLGMKDWDMIYFVPQHRGNVVEEKSDVCITLKVQDARNRRVYRTMRMTDKLEVLFDLYRSLVAVERHWGVFLLECRRLCGEKTPAELEMEDGDELDYFLHMYGG